METQQFNDRTYIKYLPVGQSGNITISSNLQNINFNPPAITTNYSQVRLKGELSGLASGTANISTLLCNLRTFIRSFQASCEGQEIVNINNLGELHCAISQPEFTKMPNLQRQGFFEYPQHNNEYQNLNLSQGKFFPAADCQRQIQIFTQDNNQLATWKFLCTNGGVNYKFMFDIPFKLLLFGTCFSVDKEINWPETLMKIQLETKDKFQCLTSAVDQAQISSVSGIVSNTIDITLSNLCLMIPVIQNQSIPQSIEFICPFIEIMVNNQQSNNIKIQPYGWLQKVYLATLSQADDNSGSLQYQAFINNKNANGIAANIYPSQQNINLYTPTRKWLTNANIDDYEFDVFLQDQQYDCPIKNLKQYKQSCGTIVLNFVPKGGQIGKPISFKNEDIQWTYQYDQVKPNLELDVNYNSGVATQSIMVVLYLRTFRVDNLNKKYGYTD